MLKIWKRLASELSAHRRVFFVLVTGSSKGSPGKAGCLLLLTETGVQVGTIGGGCMERELLRTGRDALASGSFRTRVQTLVHHKTDDSNASGLICGGSQSNLLALVSPAQLPVVESVTDSLVSGNPGVLSITADSWCYESGLESDHSIRFEELADSWRVKLSTLNRRRVAIFGGGHCGVALARQMELLDYVVTIIEPREGLFTLMPFQKQTRGPRILNAENFAAGAGLVDHPEKTFAVILSPSYHDDVNALSGILRCPFPYIGIMGSPAKLAKIQEGLYSLNFDPQEWERVTAPAGLSIDSDSPEEIAVSIAAQILKEADRLDLK